ncbi:hypothetical protein [Modestobacter versicolor]|uniref:hypothetical protein n=1 Tax=Modestobacter versicolor TaxID=429133 RepID=UPI0034DF4E0D
MSVSLAPGLGERSPALPGSAGVLVRGLHSVALGTAAGGLTGMVVAPHGWFVLAFCAGFAVWLLLTMARLSGAVSRALPGPPPAGSRLALARVEAIRRTGLEVNDQPQCELTLVVSPATLRQDTGPAYATTTPAVLDVVTLPSFQPGSVVVVSRPDPARPDVVVVPAPPADARAAARAEARVEPGNGALPPLGQVHHRASTPTPGLGLRRPTAGGLLVGLVLTAGAAVSVLLPAFLG